MQVQKHRSFYAPLLIWMGGPLLRILDTGVRVLPQREWEERERQVQRGSAARRFGSMPAARSSCRVSLERRWRSCWRIRSWRSASGSRAIERAVVALAEFHHLGFTHGDAMAENVLVDLEAGAAHWFDFETIHDASRPVAWRRADDVRALLVTCLVRTGPRSAPGSSS